MGRISPLLLPSLKLYPKLLQPILQLPRLPWLQIRVEHNIHLLERPPRCLGVHEEDVEGHHGAEHAEDDVCFPLDVRERRRDEVGQGEVEDPVCCGGDADAFGAVF